MFEESYHIELEAFSGPFDLLLQLIEKRKLHVSDISLSRVTDDFILFIKEKEHFPLGLSANFILVASTLLLLKSKSLLPALELTREEEASIENLEARLKEYQRVKDLTIYVKALFGRNIIWARLPVRQEVRIFAPDPRISTAGVFEAAHVVLENLPKKETERQATVAKTITLEETIGSLTERIGKALRMSFRDFAGHRHGSPVSHDEKVTVIVGFLAMLELAKQGIIAVKQEGLFDEIHMETETIGVPHYE